MLEHDVCKQVNEHQFTVHTRATWTHRIQIKHRIISFFYKMVKLTKYTIILMCRARTNWTSIKELCNIYGYERKTILRILHQHLVLPIDNGLSYKWRKEMHFKEHGWFKIKSVFNIRSIKYEIPEGV